ncbi:tail assembly chaperone [Mycobacterium phage GreaseLightnin]|uniref:Tail assembly chaperone n=1 Tax=Mycobacterium phage GreaseLightnin TaxID=2517951 RepID=A0A482JJX6_9CAUD|nr:tail assembly chaperone [Mycobacterium phage GreaseLightnin]QBP31886.1 tail assembly chaperone [Mycobacterium phage GreaseLightnin]
MTDHTNPADVEVPRSADVETAKEQAADYFGFIASEYITVTLPDGTVERFEVPNPSLLDDEQQERWNELQFEIQQCDRLPDIEIPAHKLRSKTTYVNGEEIRVGADGEIVGGEVRVEESETYIPARTVRGQLIEPFQKTQPDGAVKLMSPGYHARCAIALWGEDGYQRFKAGKGNSRLISLIWQRMAEEGKKRAAADPKVDIAIDLIKLYPKQIETALPSAYPGRHIREWHQGRMSSRELITLLEGLPPDSWFKSALLADLKVMRNKADRNALDAIRAQTDGLLTGAVDVGPLELTVDEKRKPSKE